MDQGFSKVWPNAKQSIREPVGLALLSIDLHDTSEINIQIRDLYEILLNPYLVYSYIDSISLIKLKSNTIRSNTLPYSYLDTEIALSSVDRPS